MDEVSLENSETHDSGLALLEDGILALVQGRSLAELQNKYCRSGRM
jgi:hypothetical protein